MLQWSHKIYKNERMILMTKPKDKDRLTISMNNSTKEALFNAAKERGITVTALVNILINDMLNKKKVKINI